MSLWGGISATTVSYTFTSAKWEATSDGNAANWNSIKDGNFSGGVQVTTKTTGATANSPVSYDNISKVTVHYHTNAKDGVGTISLYNVSSKTATAQSGTIIGKSFSVKAPSSNGKDSKECSFVPSTSVSGYIQIYVTCSTNSIYIESIDIEYGSGSQTPTTNTLTISPASGELKKATDVTLTASVADSKIYYTTDGTEPTTSSEQYTSGISVTKSGTTIKALAVAEGKDNVTAEATYTIKPDKPVFSSESKTFNAAFDVTLSLPETTDNTSKIYYAIGKTATAESTPYTEPINISADNEGDKVILHAVVVDEYGNVGSEKYCTYTKSIQCVFDFTANPNVWGITPLGSHGKTDNNVVAGKELEVGGVVMTAKNGTQYGTCIYLANDNSSLRVYGGGSITFTAPTGYNILNISFAGANLENIASVVGTYTSSASSKAPSSSWTGEASSVTFSASKSTTINTATISLSKVATPEATTGTLTFKAQLSEGDYYATFSSDKDVVFTDDVVVKTAEVNGNTLTLTDLDATTYEVTDGTAKSIKGYYVPANTGILVNSLEETATYYYPKTAQTITFDDNALKAAPAEGGVFTAEADYKYYKLAYDDYNAKTGLGFYWGADNGGAFNVKAGTAYLAVPAAVGSNAKGFLLDGSATGISNINKANVSDKQIYNLAGQRVATMHTAGLYIVNGKKVVVRK